MAKLILGALVALSLISYLPERSSKSPQVDVLEELPAGSSDLEAVRDHMSLIRVLQERTTAYESFQKQLRPTYHHLRSQASLGFIHGMAHAITNKAGFKRQEIIPLVRSILLVAALHTTAGLQGLANKLHLLRKLRTELNSDTRTAITRIDSLNAQNPHLESVFDNDLYLIVKCRALTTLKKPVLPTRQEMLHEVAPATIGAAAGVLSTALLRSLRSH